ncbi:ankyrin repeat domain-containing protein [Sphingobacterium psychroaquaticum]|uniref:ankyrin repeat domain-containing protein n=1 Tax=Sphingobacterium psychroaquaticum TaxID=561061 RepID=UPI001F105AD5|nr:ankyrin repeat domain-containing protein [Sphingobacterium psychroaquaticum]
MMERFFIKVSMIVALLLVGGATFSSCQEKQKNSMMNVDIISAVKAGNLTSVTQLLDQHVAINTANQQGESLLLLATQRNNVAMAELLVSRGADVNQQASNLDSPFLFAGASGFTKLVSLYLKNGARFDIFNRYNGTALIPACERGHVETVRLLANTPNFPIDHVNRLGWTALIEAVILGDGSAKYVQIVNVLLQAGVNPSIADNQGVTPLQHARKKGFTNIVTLLEGK